MLSPMTNAQAEDLFRRWRTAWANRDLVMLGSCYAENCVVESPAFGRLIGRSAIQKAFQNWWTTFPDAVIDFRDLLIMGERIAQTLNIQGTDTGGFLGHAPTGRPFRLFIVILFAVENRQIVQEQRVYDVNGRRLLNEPDSSTIWMLRLRFSARYCPRDDIRAKGSS
jgi:predicted ester cyclase